MWQIILTIVLYTWLFAVLALLWSIWRDAVKRYSRMERTLVEVATKSAEAARLAAEAVLREKARHAE